jgi:hypothetical protein
MFGFGKSLGESVGKTAANTALRVFIDGILKNGWVIADQSEVKPEALAHARKETEKMRDRI